MNQTTPGPEQAMTGPDPTAPLIRALPLRPGSGRTYVTYTAQGATAGLLRVTPRGHWYCEQDAACRGCGTTLIGPAAGMARTDAVLDRQGRCAHPATARDIAAELLASVPRPAPATPRHLWTGVAA